MKGEVVYLYAFDVANEVVTAKVPEILARKPVPFTIRIDRTLPRSAPLYQPLAIEPPLAGVTLGGQPVRALVRVYGVGVVTVTFRVGFERAGVLDLLPFHHPAVDDGRALEHVAGGLCAEVRQGLREFLVRGSPPTEPEAYTAFCLTEVAGVDDTSRWLAENRSAVAGLLSETDPGRLSEAQVVEALRLQRSFERTDLVVIDWDAALVVDLGGYVDDVLYALELANLQLEEFRAMDRALDRYLDRAYADLERRPVSLLGASTAVLRKLRWLRVDLTKLADEVTHITKFVGDWYLARVYLAVRERFHLDQWRASVEQRLAQLDRLYTAAHAEVNERRMLWLEVLIVVFFAIDLLALFLLKK
jgi:hypothetical protein